MNERLADIIQKILLVAPSEVTMELTRNDLDDWDSMTHLVLITEIEKEFSIQFSDDEVVEIESVKDLVTLLSKRGAL